MATPIFPATLPLVSSCSLSPSKQVISTDADVGPLAFRRRTSVPGAECEVSWRFMETDFSIFQEFWKTDLLRGHRWFYLVLPCAYGLTYHVVRFKKHRQAKRDGYAYRTVTATLEVRERAYGLVVPPIVDPTLVAAFDFETGYVNLVNPDETIFVAGSFVADTVNFVNGTQSARLSAANYFGLFASTAYGMGTGDFGIEMHVRMPNPPGFESIDIVGFNHVFNWYYNGSPIVQNQPLSGAASSSVTGAAHNVFQHVFFGREDGKMYHSLNGAFTGIPPDIFTDGAEAAYNVGSSAFIAFGNRDLSGPFFSGIWNVDRIRVYKGRCPYTAAFTPSTSMYEAP